MNYNGKLKIRLMGRYVKALVDTGCTASVMGIQWRHMIPELASLPVERPDYDGMTVANGQTDSLFGKSLVPAVVLGSRPDLNKSVKFGFIGPSKWTM